MIRFRNGTEDVVMDVIATSTGSAVVRVWVVKENKATGEERGEFIGDVSAEIVVTMARRAWTSR